jgi:hemoglobin
MILGAHALINKLFAATAADPNRLASFKDKLVDQICRAGGGPFTYTGKSMKEAHQDMGVTTADFNAVVEDLVKALDKLKVGDEGEK